MANRFERGKPAPVKRIVLREFALGYIRGFDYFKDGEFKEPMGQIVKVEGEKRQKVVMGNAGDYVIGKP